MLAVETTTVILMDCPAATVLKLGDGVPIVVAAFVIVIEVEPSLDPKLRSPG